MAEASAVVARLHDEGALRAARLHADEARRRQLALPPQGLAPRTAPARRAPAPRRARRRAPRDPRPRCTPPRAPGAAQPAPAARSRRKRQIPFAAEGILGLSADELRKRALRINPYRTAWIGRVDTIPPQSDERTALIDRGLILRGLLTEQQIAEIHRVGDLWLRHHEAAFFAGGISPL